MEVLDIMTTKITITRALAEIKLLQKRIESGTRSLAVVGYQQNNKMQSPYNHMEIEAFEKKALADLSSVEGLIERLTEVKTAIDKSNSVTTVKIGSREMTIQEVLVEKNYIEHKKDLLSKLKQQMAETKRRLEACAERVEEEVRDVRQSYTEKNADSKVIEEMCETTRNLNYPKLVDPCGLMDKIEKLTQEIEDFKNNVDYALSESNSVTYIEV